MIKENISIHDNYEGVLADPNESGAFKEVRASVFGSSEIEEQPPKVDQHPDYSEVISPKELKFKREKVQLK